MIKFTDREHAFMWCMLAGGVAAGKNTSSAIHAATVANETDLLFAEYMKRVETREERDAREKAEDAAKYPAPLASAQAGA